MVFKKISVRKTPTGYSLYVFVRDGELVKPLYFGIQRFFDKADKVGSGQIELGNGSSVEDFIKDVKEAKNVSVYEKL